MGSLFRLAAVAALVALPILAACSDGGDVGSAASGSTSSATALSASLCTAASTFESAVKDLGDVDVIQNGTAALDRAVDGVGTALDHLRSAARSEFRDDVDAVHTSLDSLSSTVSTIPDANSAGEAAQSLRQPLLDFVDDAASLVTKVSQGCD